MDLFSLSPKNIMKIILIFLLECVRLHTEVRGIWIFRIFISFTMIVLRVLKHKLLFNRLLEMFLLGKEHGNHDLLPVSLVKYTTRLLVTI